MARITKQELYVYTNMGFIPVDTYLNASAKEMGYETYADLRKDGKNIEIGAVYKIEAGKPQKVDQPYERLFKGINSKRQPKIKDIFLPKRKAFLN
jgi:hypothetical protein